MTDHAALLRQIRTDARPYVEQWLELATVFSGFRKLASENGLDWGVIKALIKAEIQDELEGGSNKVDRIIEKADFAAAYADMLGLGTKMNELKITSVRIDPVTGEIIERPASGPPAVETAQGGGVERPAGDRQSLEASSVGPSTEPRTGVASEGGAVAMLTASPSQIISEPEAGCYPVEGETAPVSGDAGEKPDLLAFHDASPNISSSVADNTTEAAAGSLVAVRTPAADIPDLPDFLDRRRVA
jgi:hypothetical protein